MRIDRLLAITVILLNRDRITARELAAKFEVSVRTIYRDLETIDQAGIPIMSFSGNRGGYGIMDTFRIDRQYLTFEDIVSLVSTLRGVNNTLENRELDLALEKILNLVPAGKTAEFKRISEQILVDLIPLGYTQRQKIRIKTVHQAIHEQKILEFEYYNYQGEKTRRRVEPMTLIFKGYAWYLFAFCHLRTDYRLFRLSRIQSLSLGPETFERRNKSYKDIFTLDPDSFTLIHLKLRFLPQVRVQVEDFFEPDQIHIEKVGTLLVETDFPEDPWILTFLLGYGDCVQVLEPVSVREQLLEKAKKIVSYYKPDNQLSQT
jgi:predicted DNA-binding transcriptional regulator YafY